MSQLLSVLNQSLIYLVLGELALIIMLIVLVMILFTKYGALRDSYEDFMEGRDGRSLEEMFSMMSEDNRKVKQQCKHNIEAIVEMKKNLNLNNKLINYKILNLQAFTKYNGGT